MNAEDAPEAVLNAVAADGPLLAHHGMTLEAVAEVVKAGARMASLRAEVRAEDLLVAHGIFNFVLGD